nr:MAG TPA: hypothetical protein [Caudoviricetes sp.]
MKKLTKYANISIADTKYKAGGCFEVTALLTRATYNCYYTVNLCNCQWV